MLLTDNGWLHKSDTPSHCLGDYGFLYYIMLLKNAPVTVLVLFG